MAAPSSADRPIFLIVAGPNGSGKSTAYEEALPELQDRTVWIVNPDRLTRRLHDAEKLAASNANLAAVERIETWLDASLAVHKSVGVETVLSTPKYRRLVKRAQTLGYQVWLVYVLLADPDLNVERVATRVRKGGHPVPEAKIRSRYLRSLGQLPWFLEEADRAFLYDNSGAQMKLVGQKSLATLYLDPTAPPALFKALNITASNIKPS